MTRRRCRTRRRAWRASGRARRGGASWASRRARRRARETAGGRARRPSESGSRVRLLQRRRRPSECPRGSCRIPRGCRASDSPAAGPSWRVASDAGHSLPWDFTAVAARCRLRGLPATALLFRRVWHTRWSAGVGYEYSFFQSKKNCQSFGTKRRNTCKAPVASDIISTRSAT